MVSVLKIAVVAIVPCASGNHEVNAQYDAYGNGTMVECSQPAPRTCTFYEGCMEEVHPCGSKGYALDYGAYFCEQFKTKLGGIGAKLGKHKLENWMWATSLCLQLEMGKILPASDLSCEELQSKAIEQHVKCYTDSGFCDLCITDLPFIVNVIGLKGMFAQGALKQMVDQLSTCMRPGGEEALV